MQTVQIRIRLDRGLHCLPIHLHHLDAFLNGNTMLLIISLFIYFGGGGGGGISTAILEGPNGIITVKLTQLAGHYFHHPDIFFTNMLPHFHLCLLSVLFSLVTPIHICHPSRQKCNYIIRRHMSKSVTHMVALLLVRTPKTTQYFFSINQWRF